MLLENSENEETFLIYLFEWEPGLTELNSNFLPKCDTLMEGDWIWLEADMQHHLRSLLFLYSEEEFDNQLKAYAFNIHFILSSEVFPLTDIPGTSKKVCRGGLVLVVCKRIFSDELGKLKTAQEDWHNHNEKRLDTR